MTFLNISFIYYISLFIYQYLSIYQHECFHIFNTVWIYKESCYFQQVYSLPKQNFKILHSKHQLQPSQGTLFFHFRILKFIWGLFVTTMMATDVVQRKFPCLFQLCCSNGFAEYVLWQYSIAKFIIWRLWNALFHQNFSKSVQKINLRVDIYIRLIEIISHQRF